MSSLCPRQKVRLLPARRRLLIFALWAFAAMPSLLVADSTLRGLVEDPSGSVVAGALVRARSAVTGVATESRTNDAGEYAIKGLPEGGYRIEVSETAFQRFRSDVILLGADETKTVSPRLQLKALEQQLVVTTSRREEELLASPNPTFLIDREAIEDTATQTLEQLLVEQAGSGVYVSRGFGLGFPSINGIGGNRVLVLVDGQRQIGTDNGTRDGIDLDQFTTANVDRVEVSKGAASPLYGSDAMGGVIQIITRQPDEPFYFELDNNYGSFGEANVNSTMGFRKDNLGATVSGLYQEYDGYDLDETNPGTSGLSGGENAFIDRQLSPSVFYDFADTVKFRVNSNYYRRNTNFVAPDGTDQLDSIQERWSVGPRLEFTVGPTTLITVRGDYSTARRFDAQRIETLQQFEALGSSQTTSINTLQYGFDARRKELTRPGLGSEQDITIPLGEQGQRTVTVRSGWVQDEIRLLNNRLTLSGGFRYENNSQFGSNLSPKAGAVLRLSDQHRLRFSYGEGFRAPDVSELYSEFANSGFFAFVGNPKLTPEESRSYSAGWTFLHPRVRYSLDLFYNRFKNGIGFAQVDVNDPFDPFFEQFIDGLGGAPLYTNGNLGDYDARGVNSGLDLLLPFGFRTTLNYTLLDRVTVSDTASDGNRMTGLGNVRNSAFFKIARSDEFRVGLRSWSLMSNLRATIRGREALANTASFDEPVDSSRLGQTEFVPAYQSWDLTVALETALSERTRLRPYFAINNIGNFIPRGLEYGDGAAVMNAADDPNSVLFREPGRTFKGGVRFRF